MKSLNLWVSVERQDGTLLKQRVCKIKADAPQEEISKHLQNYKKILGSGYYIVDWFIDV